MANMGSEGGKDRMKLILLAINCMLVAVGNSGGPLLMRLYFVSGGHRVWLCCFLQTLGFPIILIPLTVSYIRRSRNISSSEATKPKMISMKAPLFFASAFIGILTGLDNYFFAFGVARLPVSTATLLIATQLGFTAFFAFLMVRQRFTPYSVNAIFLLTAGAGILALHTNGDRAPGQSSRDYVMGFVLSVAGAALYGFVLPLIEWVYKKIKQPLTFSLVMEIQFVLCLFATLFCLLGMIINNDFKVIPREAKTFKHGEGHYYVVLAANVVMWQAFFMGAIGVVFCSSSLFSGILIAVLLPITEVLAVIFFKEKFQPEKWVSLVLSLWGFVSYFYGEIKQLKKMKQKKNTTATETELPRYS